MGKTSKQLNIQNVKNIIQQKSFKQGTIETKCKLLYRMANFLVQTNSLKHMNHGLDSYNKIYDMMSSAYGHLHPRSTNALLRIISTEEKIQNRKYHMKYESKKNK